METLGRKRGNPQADVKNFTKFPVSVTGVSGKDTLSYTTAGGSSVTAITYDGVIYPLATVGTADQPKKVRDSILQVLEKYEINAVINVKYVGGAVVFYHIGEGTISGVTIAGASRATTRLSNVVVKADNVASVVGIIAPMTANGSSVALANSPYAYSGVYATDQTKAALLATDVAAALTTLGVSGSTVSVFVDNIKGKFKVTINSVRDNDFSIGGITMTKKNFTEIYA